MSGWEIQLLTEESQETMGNNSAALNFVFHLSIAVFICWGVSDENRQETLERAV